MNIYKWNSFKKRILELDKDIFSSDTYLAITLAPNRSIWFNAKHEVYMSCGSGELFSRVTILENVSYNSMYIIAKTLIKEKNNEQNKNN